MHLNWNKECEKKFFFNSSFFFLLSIFILTFLFYRTLTNSSKPQQQQYSRFLLFFLLIDSIVVVDWCSTSDTSSTSNHICAISFVSKMKKILVLSLPILSFSLSLSHSLYLMWSPVVKMFFSAWFVWIEILQIHSFSFSVSRFFTVFFIIAHQPIYSYWNTNHQEN
jgi:hypothetical protein